jgi:hypothetical protein
MVQDQDAEINFGLGFENFGKRTKPGKSSRTQRTHWSHHRRSESETARRQNKMRQSDARACEVQKWLRKYHVDQHCHRQVNITAAVRLQKHGIRKHSTAALLRLWDGWQQQPPRQTRRWCVCVCVSRWGARAVVPPLSANFAKILELLRRHRRRRKIIIADLITRSLSRPIHRYAVRRLFGLWTIALATLFSPARSPQPHIPSFYLITSHRISCQMGAHVNLVIARGIKTLRNLAWIGADVKKTAVSLCAVIFLAFINDIESWHYGENRSMTHSQ